MDMLTLIDEVDAIVRNARPVPLTPQVRIDKQPVLDLLDRMRGEIVRAGNVPAPGVGQQALTEAVSAAIRDAIPEIAQAVAAATPARRPEPPTPPGAPF
jgi:hypothetical protein